MTYVVILLTTLFHLSFLLVQINLCTPVRILPLFYSHRAAVPRYAVVELKNEELPKVVKVLGIGAFPRANLPTRSKHNGTLPSQTRPAFRQSLFIQRWHL